MLLNLMENFNSFLINLLMIMYAVVYSQTCLKQAVKG